MRYDVQVSFSYDYAVYDLKSNSKIILTYYMLLDDDGKCPFLTGFNRCLIHDVYKPLVCRSFPYVPSEVRYFYNTNVKLLFHRSKYGLSSACKFIKTYKEYIDSKLSQDPHFLYKFARASLEAARSLEELRTKYLSTLSSLWRLGLVELIFENHSGGIPCDAYTFIRRFIPYFTL